MPSDSTYDAIISYVFTAKHVHGATLLEFQREDLLKAASDLSLDLPKNIGDLIYSFRYRKRLPEDIARTAPSGMTWLIRLAGRGAYNFCLVRETDLTPRADLLAVKVPDATPGLVMRYSQSDEQALLAKLRYNRLIDVFSGLMCYSLQSHLRTTVPELGQVEIDELYVGMDRNGSHYCLPVQAKGGSDHLSIAQIEQDLIVCRHKLPGLPCRPIGAQFMPDGTIALLELVSTADGLRVCNERHYRLVPSEDLSTEDLATYRQLSGSLA